MAVIPSTDLTKETGEVGKAAEFDPAARQDDDGLGLEELLLI